MTTTTPQNSCESCPWRKEHESEPVVGGGPPGYVIVPDPNHAARLALAKIVLVSFTLIALLCIAGVVAGRLPDATVPQVLGIFGVAVAAIGYFYFKFGPR